MTLLGSGTPRLRRGDIGARRETDVAAKQALDAFISSGGRPSVRADGRVQRAVTESRGSLRRGWDVMRLDFSDRTDCQPVQPRTLDPSDPRRPPVAATLPLVAGVARIGTHRGGLV
jgi:hypothetical protein